MNVPRECPTVVTWVALCAAIAAWTAERIFVAVLKIPLKSQKNTRWIYHLTYLACSFAKPLWVWTEELTPGKRVASKDSIINSVSVISASLYTHRIRCQFIEAGNLNWTNILVSSVPWWATITLACDGEKPTYPLSETAQSGHSRPPKFKDLQNCTEPPSPPDATGMKSEFAAQSAVNAIQTVHDLQSSKPKRNTYHDKTSWLSYLGYSMLRWQRAWRVWTTRSAPSWEEWCCWARR